MRRRQVVDGGMVFFCGHTVMKRFVKVGKRPSLSDADGVWFKRACNLEDDFFRTLRLMH